MLSFFPICLKTEVVCDKMLFWKADVAEAPAGRRHEKEKRIENANFA